MSQDATLSCSRREKVGSRSARKLRSEGRIPASLQGENAENVNLHVDETAFLSTRRHHVQLYDLDIDGAVEAAVVRELQWDALGDRLVHVEFKRVVRGVETESEIDLKFVGMPKDGVLNISQPSIVIRCIPSLIPDGVKHSVEGLEPGTHITAADLKLPEGVHLGVEPDLEVAVVAAIREELEEPAEMPSDEEISGETAEEPETPEEPE